MLPEKNSSTGAYQKHQPFSNELPTIHSIKDTVDVMSSLQRPKKIRYVLQLIQHFGKRRKSILFFVQTKG
jgi:hypothetical protein